MLPLQSPETTNSELMKSYKLTQVEMPLSSQVKPKQMSSSRPPGSF